MDLVTGEDRTIGLVYGAAAIVILALAVLFVVAARHDRRGHAELDPMQDALRDRFGADLLRGQTSGRGSDAPVSHRAPWQLPDWLRTGAAHGQVEESRGYGPPPPLAVVEEPTVAAWPIRDQNSVSPLLNPAVGAARVPRHDRWETLDVINDVLRGRMEAAANSEDTGLIPQIRAEVAQ